MSNQTAAAFEPRTLILNINQAQAVYSAMCALNNVGARLDAFLEGAFHAREMADGRVVVHIVPNVTFPGSHAAEPEIYADQAAFAAAYGLQTEGQKRRQERRERDEPYLMYGVEETRTGNRA